MRSRGHRNVAGTYWYHSHQEGVVQVDKGLYGSFVVLELDGYGIYEAALSEFSLNDKFDVEYTMDLNTVNADGEISYTINGKSFPVTEPTIVKEGVKVKILNHSPEDVHPMHLHGHFFQVLSKNGKPVSGSPLMKDTLNVLPGEEYEIAFKANNAGKWMFHCHDLGHASKGGNTGKL